MRTSRKSTFWILVLGLCIGAIVLVPFFCANKANKSEAEGTQKEQTENLSKLSETTVTSNNEVKTLRERAANPLSEFEDNASITPIAIKDKRILYREIEVLEKTEDISQAVELLISALKDGDMEVREREFDYLPDGPGGLLQIEEALIRIGKPAVESLIIVLKDKHSNYARSRAIKVLGKIGDSQALKPLIAVLKDKDWDIRWRTAKALGELGDSSAIKPLTIALKDEDRRV
ncbi:HEAT repeat domain-containing protein, partial [bacterium]|nr:HEAT repeat domain-containing protein [bacterium]